MELQTAVQLIRKGVQQNSQPQTWADLGAGRGLFTNALSTLLATGSSIHAIDASKGDLQQIKADLRISLHKMQLDFVKDKIITPPLDGVLMANSLHFVKDKAAFFEKIKVMMKQQSKMVLVEYEMETASRWVPYPINFRKLQELAKALGLLAPVALEETPSLYNGKIYSALLKF